MAICPHLKELEAWARQGSEVSLPGELAEHAEECPRCRDLLEEVVDIREAVRSIPVHTLSSQRREAMRFDLMAATRRAASPGAGGDGDRRARRWRLAAIAIAASLAAAVVGALLLRAGSSDDAAGDGPLAQVTLEGDARGEAVSIRPDEIYHLIRGAAEVEVRHLAPDERFRVLAGDGVVEVRGTRFRIVVSDGRLTEVSVRDGHVLVDVGDRRTASLTAGERWVRPTDGALATASASDVDQSDALPPPVTTDVVESREIPAIAAPAPRPYRRPAQDEAPHLTSVAPEPEPLLPDVTDNEEQDVAPNRESEEGPSAGDGGPAPAARAAEDEAFDRAWQLLRSGRPQAAARAFDVLWSGAVLDAERRADVLYWAAESYRRGGDLSAAESRAAMLLRETPSAWRAPEANLILGEAALRRGDIATARAALERAAASSRPSVSTRARRVLESLDDPP